MFIKSKIEKHTEQEFMAFTHEIYRAIEDEPDSKLIPLIEHFEKSLNTPRAVIFFSGQKEAIRASPHKYWRSLKNGEPPMAKETSGPASNVTHIQGKGDRLILPARIANLHRGKDFINFDTFRRSVWKSIANDPELAAHFDSRSLRRMTRGNAPIVDDRDIDMSQLTYVLHHVTPISEGGGVYDMTNIKVVTPLVHNRIHYGVKP